MASVFISFVHEDQKIADAIKYLIQEELEPDGPVFLSSDLGQVRPGEQWVDKIRTALESCEVLISLLSARSIKRPWINFEAGAAWIQKRPVIPVCFGKMSKASLPQPYSGMQAVALPGQEDGLLKAIAEYLGKHWYPRSEPSVNPFTGKTSDEMLSMFTGRPVTPSKKRSVWYKILASCLKEYSDA